MHENEVAAAEQALRLVMLWKPPGTRLGRAIMIAHLLSAEHNWTVVPADASNGHALRAMHNLAHLTALCELQEAAAEAEAYEKWAEANPEQAARNEAEAAQYGAWYDAQPHDLWDSAEYELFCAQQSHMCQAEYTVHTAPRGRWDTDYDDPYASGCEHGNGHYPHTLHSAEHPLGTGTVEWGGGGYAAGDALPYRDVKWTRPRLFDADFAGGGCGD